MTNINMGSLNINGARSDVKRASLYKLIDFKKLDVVFIQETHSDDENERDWKKEWPGQVFLSHKSFNSAGVGVLFNKAFNPHSVEVQDVLSGHILKVRAQFENAQRSGGMPHISIKNCTQMSLWITRSWVDGFLTTCLRWRLPQTQHWTLS